MLQNPNKVFCVVGVIFMDYFFLIVLIRLFRNRNSLAEIKVLKILNQFSFLRFQQHYSVFCIRQMIYDATDDTSVSIKLLLCFRLIYFPKMLKLTEL